MAVQKICHFWADRRIVNLRHEGLTILMQCHLGICRGPFTYQKPPFDNFCDEWFSRKLMRRKIL